MKKKRMPLPWSVFTGIMLCLLSCGVDRWSAYYPQTGRDLWIDSVMRADYLWYEELPAFNDLNYFKSPTEFLKSMRAAEDNSYSSVDSLYDTPLPDYGFTYSLYKSATSDTTYSALITYVTPGSAAAQAGLQRGEWIMLVDADSITKKREYLIQNGDARQLLIGRYQTEPDGEGGQTSSIHADHTATLPAASSVNDVLVPVSQILDYGQHKVGYLVYRRFCSEADRELCTFATRCQEEGVTDFVLDLRYNNGGETACVHLLADILLPAGCTGAPLMTLEYNTKNSSKNRTLTVGTQRDAHGAANLNLDRVYILTDKITAGASELLINSLQPYMDVVQIGQNTKGVPVGIDSYSNPTHRWILHLAVCHVFNAQGEAALGNGFAPTHSASETADLSGYLPLGHPNETLLHTALSLIAEEADNTSHL